MERVEEIVYAEALDRAAAAFTSWATDPGAARESELVGTLQTLRVAVARLAANGREEGVTIPATCKTLEELEAVVTVELDTLIERVGTLTEWEGELGPLSARVDKLFDREGELIERVAYLEKFVGEKFSEVGAPN